MNYEEKAAIGEALYRTHIQVKWHFSPGGPPNLTSVSDRTRKNSVKCLSQGHIVGASSENQTQDLGIEVKFESDAIPIRSQRHIKNVSYKWQLCLCSVVFFTFHIIGCRIFSSNFNSVSLSVYSTTCAFYLTFLQVFYVIFDNFISLHNGSFKSEPFLPALLVYIFIPINAQCVKF